MFFFLKSGVVVHAFNPNTQEVEARKLLWIQGQQGLTLQVGLKLMVIFLCQPF